MAFVAIPNRGVWRSSPRNIYIILSSEIEQSKGQKSHIIANQNRGTYQYIKILMCVCVCLCVTEVGCSGGQD